MNYNPHEQSANLHERGRKLDNPEEANAAMDEGIELTLAKEELTREIRSAAQGLKVQEWFSSTEDFQKALAERNKTVQDLFLQHPELTRSPELKGIIESGFYEHDQKHNEEMKQRALELIAQTELSAEELPLDEGAFAARMFQGELGAIQKDYGRHFGSTLTDAVSSKLKTYKEGLKILTRFRLSMGIHVSDAEGWLEEASKNNKGIREFFKKYPELRKHAEFLAVASKSFADHDKAHVEWQAKNALSGMRNTKLPTVDPEHAKLTESEFLEAIKSQNDKTNINLRDYWKHLQHDSRIREALHERYAEYESAFHQQMRGRDVKQAKEAALSPPEKEKEDMKAKLSASVRLFAESNEQVFRSSDEAFSAYRKTLADPALKKAADTNKGLVAIELKKHPEGILIADSKTVAALHKMDTYFLESSGFKTAGERLLVANVIATIAAKRPENLTDINKDWLRKTGGSELATRFFQTAGAQGEKMLMSLAGDIWREVPKEKVAKVSEQEVKEGEEIIVEETVEAGEGLKSHQTSAELKQFLYGEKRNTPEADRALAELLKEARTWLVEDGESLSMDTLWKHDKQAHGALVAAFGWDKQADIGKYDAMLAILAKEWSPYLKKQGAVLPEEVDTLPAEPEEAEAAATSAEEQAVVVVKVPRLGIMDEPEEIRKPAQPLEQEAIETDIGAEDVPEVSGQEEEAKAKVTPKEGDASEASAGEQQKEEKEEVISVVVETEVERETSSVDGSMKSLELKAPEEIKQQPEVPISSEQPEEERQFILKVKEADQEEEGRVEADAEAAVLPAEKDEIAVSEQLPDDSVKVSSEEVGREGQEEARQAAKAQAEVDQAILIEKRTEQIEAPDKTFAAKAVITETDTEVNVSTPTQTIEASKENVVVPDNKTDLGQEIVISDAEDTLEEQEEEEEEDEQQDTKRRLDIKDQTALAGEAFTQKQEVVLKAPVQKGKHADAALRDVLQAYENRTQGASQEAEEPATLVSTNRIQQKDAALGLKSASDLSPPQVEASQNPADEAAQAEIEEVDSASMPSEAEAVDEVTPLETKAKEEIPVTIDPETEQAAQEITSVAEGEVELLEAEMTSVTAESEEETVESMEEIKIVEAPGKAPKMAADEASAEADEADRPEITLTVERDEQEDITGEEVGTKDATKLAENPNDLMDELRSEEDEAQDEVTTDVSIKAEELQEDASPPQETEEKTETDEETEPVPETMPTEENEDEEVGKIAELPDKAAEIGVEEEIIETKKVTAEIMETETQDDVDLAAKPDTTEIMLETIPDDSFDSEEASSEAPLDEPSASVGEQQVHVEAGEGDKVDFKTIPLKAENEEKKEIEVEAVSTEAKAELDENPDDVMDETTSKEDEVQEEAVKSDASTETESAPETISTEEDEGEKDGKAAEGIAYEGVKAEHAEDDPASSQQKEIVSAPEEQAILEDADIIEPIESPEDNATQVEQKDSATETDELAKEIQEETDVAAPDEIKESPEDERQAGLAEAEDQEDEAQSIMNKEKEAEETAKKLAAEKSANNESMQDKILRDGGQEQSEKELPDVIADVEEAAALATDDAEIFADEADSAKPEVKQTDIIGVPDEVNPGMEASDDFVIEEAQIIPAESETSAEVGPNIEPSLEAAGLNTQYLKKSAVEQLEGKPPVPAEINNVANAEFSEGIADIGTHEIEGAQEDAERDADLSKDVVEVTAETPEEADILGNTKQPESDTGEKTSFEQEKPKIKDGTEAEHADASGGDATPPEYRESFDEINAEPIPDEDEADTEEPISLEGEAHPETDSLASFEEGKLIFEKPADDMVSQQEVETVETGQAPVLGEVAEAKNVSVPQASSDDVLDRTTEDFTAETAQKGSAQDEVVAESGTKEGVPAVPDKSAEQVAITGPLAEEFLQEADTELISISKNPQSETTFPIEVVSVEADALKAEEPEPLLTVENKADTQTNEIGTSEQKEEENDELPPASEGNLREGEEVILPLPEMALMEEAATKVLVLDEAEGMPTIESEELPEMAADIEVIDAEFEHDETEADNKEATETTVSNEASEEVESTSIAEINETLLVSLDESEDTEGQEPSPDISMDRNTQIEEITTDSEKEIVEGSLEKSAIESIEGETENTIGRVIEEAEHGGKAAQAVIENADTLDLPSHENQQSKEGPAITTPETDAEVEAIHQETPDFREVVDEEKVLADKANEMSATPLKSDAEAQPEPEPSQDFTTQNEAGRGEDVVSEMSEVEFEEGRAESRGEKKEESVETQEAVVSDTRHREKPVEESPDVSAEALMVEEISDIDAEEEKEKTASAQEQISDQKQIQEEVVEYSGLAEGESVIMKEVTAIIENLEEEGQEETKEKNYIFKPASAKPKAQPAVSRRETDREKLEAKLRREFDPLLIASLRKLFRDRHITSLRDYDQAVALVHDIQKGLRSRITKDSDPFFRSLVRGTAVASGSAISSPTLGKAIADFLTLSRNRFGAKLLIQAACSRQFIDQPVPDPLKLISVLLDWLTAEVRSLDLLEDFGPRLEARLEVSRKREYIQIRLLLKNSDGGNREFTLLLNEEGRISSPQKKLGGDS